MGRYGFLESRQSITYLQLKYEQKKFHRLNQQSCSFRTNTVLRNASWGLISGFCGPDGRINNPWQIGKDFPQTSSIHTNTLTSAEKRSLRVLAHWQSLTKTGPAVSQHAINVSIQNPLHPDIQSFLDAERLYNQPLPFLLTFKVGRSHTCNMERINRSFYLLIDLKVDFSLNYSYQSFRRIDETTLAK